ncbi:MAG: LysM domain-containing protein [Bacillales bacterium]|nr:LysM domain-containing protein [Bacillales bacterium]
MHPIIVNDFVYGKEFIVDVKELNVNLTKNFDVKVKGKLVYEGGDEDFEKVVKYDKDIFTKEIYVQDISYEINGKTLLLSIQIGEKEEPSQLSLDEEYASLLKRDNIEVISTVDELPSSDILEIVEEDNKDDNEEKDDEEDDDKDKYNQNKEEYIEDIKREDLNKEENSDESSLFKDEYVSSFFFYRIREKETVSDIATKFKVNKDTLLAANPKKSFLPNELILIPR